MHDVFLSIPRLHSPLQSRKAVCKLAHCTIFQENPIGKTKERKAGFWKNYLDENNASSQYFSSSHKNYLMHWHVILILWPDEPVKLKTLIYLSGFVSELLWKKKWCWVTVLANAFWKKSLSTWFWVWSHKIQLQILVSKPHILPLNETQ